MKANSATEGGTANEALYNSTEEPLTSGALRQLATLILPSEVSERTLTEKNAFVLEQLLKEPLVHLPQKRHRRDHQEFRNAGLEVKQC